MQIQFKPIKEISEKLIYEFLLPIDKEIVPPMSSRINLKAYPSKIKELSIGVAAMHNEELAGLSVIYPPGKIDNYVYCSFVGISAKFRKKGISKKLVYEVIKIAKEYNATGIKLQTWESAIKLIHFYNSFGFIRYGTEDNRNYYEKSVLLKLDFK